MSERLHEPLAPSDLDDGLEQKRLVAERTRLHRWAVLGLILGRGLDEHDSSTVGLEYPPQSAPSADKRADRELSRSGSPFDLTVRKAKYHDRCSGHPGLLRFPRINTLNVDRVWLVFRDPSHQPEHALSAQLLAHHREGASRGGEVVLEVAVRVADHKRFRGHRTPPCALDIPASRGHKPATSSARESASEEGHRQEPGQTGAGVALPESCCATGRRGTHRRDETNERPLLRLVALDPNVEVDALTVDDVLLFANLGLGNDPLLQDDVPLERNLERELNPRAAVRKVETRVVSRCDQASSSTGVRGA